MKCEKCDREVPDTAKFCPYCGGKLQQKEAQFRQQQQQMYQQQMYQQQLYQRQQNSNNNTSSTMLLKIVTVILAVIYVISALKNVFWGFKNVWADVSFGYYADILSDLLFVICGVCFAAIAGMLILIGFTKSRKKTKSLFNVLGLIGIILIMVSLLQVILYRVIENIYLEYLFPEFLKCILGTLAMLAVTYGLLYLSKEAPTVQYYKNMESLSDLFKDSLGSIQGVAKDMTNNFNKNTNEHRTNTSTNVQSNANPRQDIGKQSPNKEPEKQNYSKPTRLKTDRGLLGYILLSIITCGIYSYYFIYSVAKDINVACEGDGKSTGGLLKFILLSFFTCGIYSWIWEYSIGNRLASNAPRYGLNFHENGTTIIMWNLFGLLICGIGPFIAMNIIIKNTNSICAAYNHSKGFV